MGLSLVVFAVSIAAGGFGSLVGIGGGLVIVPLLSIGLGVPIKEAIAASLIGVIATSTSAAATYLSTGVVDRRLGLLLLVATASGGIAGGVTARYLDARTLAGLFAVILLFVVVQLVRSGNARETPPVVDDAGGGSPARGPDSSYVEPTTGEVVPYRPRRLIPGGLISVLAGNVSGLLGVGGGIINVPTMNLIMGVPMRVAASTSTYMLGATAAASVVIYHAAGFLDPEVAAPVALGMFAGARLGAGLQARIPRPALRYAFIAVALFFATQMALRWAGLA